MMRRGCLLRSPVYVQLIDGSRLQECLSAKVGSGFLTRVELGDGVDSATAADLQHLIDESMKKSKRYATCTTGQVFDRFGTQVAKVKALEKYIVTGNLRGGFVKPDRKFGPGGRLTGYSGGSPRPGLPWAGEE